MPDQQPFKTYVKTAGVSEELGLVFGFGIICKEQGQPYFDLQGDHIPEDAMLKAAVSFVTHAKGAVGDMHRAPDSGQVVFVFPLTGEIAKAFGLETQTTGLMIAMKPSDGMLAKFKDGTYTGFSIGGLRIRDEVVE